jgi:hypothetical protein
LNKFTSTAIQVIKVWQQLDPKQNRLVKLKTEAAAKQLRKEINAETRHIRFRNRRNPNSGTLPSEILAMELRKINDWATKYYSICCEVWELQGNKRSAALVRTIYTHFLRKLIAIRKSSIAHEAQRSASAAGRFDRMARLRIESFKRSADQLSRDWAEKIEIEALELEAGARVEKSSNQVSFISRIGEAAESTPHPAPTKEPTPREQPTGTNGPSTPEGIRPVTRKAHARKPLPGAIIYGVRPDSNAYVAWDGEQYVLRPSRDNVLADDSLMPIGSVQELRVDHPHPGPMGQVEVVIPTPQLTNENQNTSRSGADPQVGLVSIRSSAPLSTFEATVGQLMAQARKECPTKHLPQTEILKIAALLDNKNIPVRDNLERGAAHTMAEYNQEHPKRAVKTWQAALSLPQFRRAVRKRFSRAEEKYKKANATTAVRGNSSDNYLASP